MSVAAAAAGGFYHQGKRYAEGQHQRKKIPLLDAYHNENQCVPTHSTLKYFCHILNFANIISLFLDVTVYIYPHVVDRSLKHLRPLDQTCGTLATRSAIDVDVSHNFIAHKQRRRPKTDRALCLCFLHHLGGFPYCPRNLFQRISVLLFKSCTPDTI